VRGHVYKFAAAAAALSALAFSGCSPKKPEAYAPPDYTSWKRTTDVVLNYPIPGHQNRFRLPRMNDIGFTAVPTVVDGKKRWDFPAGTVIVKEVYDTTTPAPGESPMQLTIMAKEPKDPRSQGGWLWITRELPAGQEKIFMGTFCITCHANANEKHPYGDGNPNEEFRDFVYFVPGEKPAGGGAAGAGG
jgi:hypothetical protein